MMRNGPHANVIPLTAINYLSSARSGSCKESRQILIVNCVIRNGDGHLKNFGILYGDPVTAAHDARLSPVYDLICSTVYLPRDVLALSLLGSKAWPDRRTLERFGREACGVKNAGATIHEVVEKALTYQPEDPGSEMWKKIRAEMIAATQTLRARK